MSTNRHGDYSNSSSNCGVNEHGDFTQARSTTGKGPGDSLPGGGSRHYQDTRGSGVRAPGEKIADERSGEPDRVGAELARLGGLSMRDANSHDRHIRRLFQEAKKHGFIRGGF
jgi:hypothetical protein